MQLYVRTPSSAETRAESSAGESQQRRKARLTSILTEGLTTPPTYVLELNTLLSKASVDLKKVARVIRSDPSMSAQVIRMCNSALISFRRRVLSIEEAAILIGSERLRTLVLTCSVMEFTGRQLSRAAEQSFWRHSFLTGMLSERIARWIEYFEKEQAYLGGLLHDIGMLPLLMVMAEEKALGDDVSGRPYANSLEAEKEFFGLNHCEVGRWVGTSWSFLPSFIDVFENHHHPDRSVRDPHLVGIVAAAGRFCELHEPPVGGAAAAAPVPVATVSKDSKHSPEAGAEDEFLATCLPRLDAEERAELMEMLETEFLHLLPLIDFSNIHGQPRPEKPSRTDIPR